MNKENMKILKSKFDIIFTQRVLDAFLLLSFFYISLKIFHQWKLGGHHWQQGDWLINNAGGEVRRGLFGSVIISISDIINLNPLSLTILIQIITLAFLFVLFKFLATQNENRKITLVILISSAMFTVFWNAHPTAAVRKELIAFTAIALFGLGTVQRNWLLIWLGSIVFCISVISHEAMILFMPTLIAIIFATDLHKTATKKALINIAVVSLFSFSAFLYAILHAHVSETDIDKICAALTSRNINEGICGGAIAWLSRDIYFGFQSVILELSPMALGEFLIAYAAALIPFFYIIYLGNERVRNVLVLTILALPFFPLYFFAIDWGRWISFHIFSVSTVLLCAMANKNFHLTKKPSDLSIVLLVMLALIISPYIMIGVLWGGTINRALLDLSTYF